MAAMGLQGGTRSRTRIRVRVTGLMHDARRQFVERGWHELPDDGPATWSHWQATPEVSPVGK
jgi:hypothetical protein